MSPAPGVEVVTVAVLRIQYLLYETSANQWRSNDQVAPSLTMGPSDEENLARLDVPPNAPS